MTRAAWLRHRVGQAASLSMAPSSVPVVLSMAPPGGFPARPVLVSGEAPEEAPPPVPDPERAERAPPPPDPDPPHAGAEKSLGLSREDRILVQRGLESAGGSVGSADGIFGPRTRAALRARRFAKCRHGVSCGVLWIFRETVTWLRCASFRRSAPSLSSPPAHWTTRRRRRPHRSLIPALRLGMFSGIARIARRWWLFLRGVS